MIIICPCVWGTQTSRARARRWIGWPSQTSWATWFCTGRTSLWWNTYPSFPSHFTSCLPTRTCPASAIPTASTRYDSPTHTCAAVRRKSDKRRRTRFCFFVFLRHHCWSVTIVSRPGLLPAPQLQERSVHHVGRHPSKHQSEDQSAQPDPRYPHLASRHHLSQTTARM